MKGVQVIKSSLNLPNSSINYESDMEAQIELEEIKSQSSSPMAHVRIFVSSTFIDMHSEREMFHKFVLPEIRERCKQARIQVELVDVDLR